MARRRLREGRRPHPWPPPEDTVQLELIRDSLMRHRALLESHGIRSRKGAGGHDPLRPVAVVAATDCAVTGASVVREVLLLRKLESQGGEIGIADETEHAGGQVQHRLQGRVHAEAAGLRCSGTLVAMRDGRRRRAARASDRRVRRRSDLGRRRRRRRGGGGRGRRRGGRRRTFWQRHVPDALRSHGIARAGCGRTVARGASVSPAIVSVARDYIRPAAPLSVLDEEAQHVPTFARLARVRVVYTKSRAPVDEVQIFCRALLGLPARVADTGRAPGRLVVRQTGSPRAIFSSALIIRVCLCDAHPDAVVLFLAVVRRTRDLELHAAQAPLRLEQHLGRGLVPPCARLHRAEEVVRGLLPTAPRAALVVRRRGGAEEEGGAADEGEHEAGHDRTLSGDAVGRQPAKLPWVTL
mmetsp:Transcript_60479/g.159003  ORF Transcript_60479/g.159003 Transcript_60479/m.159003 type:complete len:411 (-) Transcript_60479:40-1272(-)